MGGSSCSEELQIIKASLKGNNVQEAVKRIKALTCSTVPGVVVEEERDVILNDIVEVAKMFQNESEFVILINLLTWSLELLKRIEKETTCFQRLTEWGNLVAMATRSMRRNVMKTEIENHALPFQQSLLATIQAVNCDKGSAKKETEALCLYFLAGCDVALENNHQAEENCQMAILAMKDGCGDGMKKKALTAAIYHINAVTNHEQNKFEAAIQQYTEAIDVFVSSEDIGPEEKQQNIDVINAWRQRATDRLPID
ncbi:unnamed protein product [Clavelina lepadiformis]|uniref:Uncharacterized protein n=1 Tax=Clavelina lepadiformis TaxID=159417 RepID=A0ABP0GAL1_CLALP